MGNFKPELIYPKLALPEMGNFYRAASAMTLETALATVSISLFVKVG